jgi:hypothetical protein
VDWCASSEVVEYEGVVGCCGYEDGGFGLVEGTGCETVYGGWPGEDGGWLGIRSGGVMDVNGRGCAYGKGGF